MTVGIRSRSLWILALIAVASVGGIGLEREYAIVRERRAWLNEFGALADPNPELDNLPSEIPFWRKWLGDKPVTEIAALLTWTDKECARVQELFPEAYMMTNAEFAAIAKAIDTDFPLSQQANLGSDDD